MKPYPLVSIIIPTRDSADFLDACLASIKKQTYKNIEIIVVDNNSIDQTKAIGKKYTDTVYNKGPERSAQRNFGAKNANGAYFLFIDSDMELTPKVIEQSIITLNAQKELAALVIPEESVGIGFWAQCKALERSFYVDIDWIEAARFFKKEIFCKLNGYDENNTGTEDYDLPQRLMNIYGKNTIGRINNLIIHNEGRLSLLKTLTKKMYYARNIKRYVETNEPYYSKQSNIFLRFQLYFTHPFKLFRNPFIGIGMLFLKSCEFIIGGITYFRSSKNNY
jgi:glycosyltransferase involved in cell wall biosynthesis